MNITKSEPKRRGRKSFNLVLPRPRVTFTIKDLESKHKMSHAGILARLKKEVAAHRVEEVGVKAQDGPGRPESVYIVKSAES